MPCPSSCAQETTALTGSVSGVELYQQDPTHFFHRLPVLRARSGRGGLAFSPVWAYLPAFLQEWKCLPWSSVQHGRLFGAVSYDMVIRNILKIQAHENLKGNIQRRGMDRVMPDVTRFFGRITQDRCSKLNGLELRRNRQNLHITIQRPLYHCCFSRDDHEEV